MKKIVIGTRGSILALAQAEKVKELLQKKFDFFLKNDRKKIESIFKENVEKLEIEIKVIVTKGDKNMQNFEKIKSDTQKDLFVKEIEKEMLEKKIDLAVHSLKDMPQKTPEGLINISFPAREDSRDVLISKTGKSLKNLTKGAVIGTGSARRKKEILNLRRDLSVKGIRGNIHTRLKKLETEDYDAIVLAAAGLKRVGLENKITQYFSDDEIMPSPGQAILCVECRNDDEIIKNFLLEINDCDTKLICVAEREFSKIFDGGCHTPIGCCAKILDDKITVKGMYYNGNKRISCKISGKKEDAKKLAQELAQKIKKQI